MPTSHRFELEIVEGARKGTFKVADKQAKSRPSEGLSAAELVVASAFYYKHMGRTANFHKDMLHYLIGHDSHLAARIRNRQLQPHLVKKALRELMRKSGILGETELFLRITVLDVLDLPLIVALVKHPYSEWVLRTYHGNAIVNQELAKLRT